MNTLLKSQAKEVKIILVLFLIILLSKGVNHLRADQWLTDQPETLKYEYGKANVFSSLTKTKSGSTIITPALEANIGVLTDLQCKMTVPGVLSLSRGQSSAYGWGDVKGGIKYRFIHETETMPQVAFYPKFVFPSGASDLNVGNGGAVEAFPVCIQKSWGNWKLSGGGGYALNQGSGKFNFGFGGVLLRRIVTDALTLGGEFYAQSATSLTSRASLIFNAGGTYNFNDTYFLIFSVGNSIAGQRNFVSFIGFGLNWRSLCH